MAVRVNKSIIINNTNIELKDFIDHSERYLDIFRAQFKPSTFEKKSQETHEQYLKRLFALLYFRLNKQERVVNRQPTQKTENDLCFDIIRRSAKSSRVIFKASGNSYRMSNEILDSIMRALDNKSSKNLCYSDKTVGVELEFMGDSRKIDEFNEEMRALVGSDNFVCSLRYIHNDGKRWILGDDGSICSSRRDKRYTTYHRALELTSPILRLSSKKDMKMLSDVCDLIKNTLNAYTNKSCGTHVHISFDINKNLADISKSRPRDNPVLCYFVKSYRKSEDSLFDKLVSNDRRKNRNKYSRTCNIEYMNTRYRKLNTTCYRQGSSNLHLEFRQLDGTLESKNIIAWAKIQSMFVDNVLKLWYQSQIIEKGSEPEVDMISIEDIVVSDMFRDSHEKETLMKMARMIA